MITINELLKHNERMQKSARKFYEGVDEFCKNKGKKLDCYYVGFDEIEVSDRNGSTIIAGLKGMCCADGDVYFFEDDPNAPFWPETIDPNDLMDVLVSLRDTGKKYEFN